MSARELSDSSKVFLIFCVENLFFRQIMGVVCPNQVDDCQPARGSAVLEVDIAAFNTTVFSLFRHLSNGTEHLMDGATRGAS